MKINTRKLFRYILMLSFVAILSDSYSGGNLFKRKDGTDPGYTGSPGDTLKNCTVCHGGTAVYIPDWISSNIPASGYLPGNLYSFRLVNTSLGHNRFGFEVSPQGGDGKLLGTFVVSDTLRTKLVGDNKYLTYRSAGVDGQDSNVWTFDWIAPDTFTQVTFYAAFNSNQDGHKGGDLTRLSRLTVYKQGHTGIKENANSLGLMAYPNPATDNIHIKASQDLISDAKYVLTDLLGRIWESGNWPKSKQELTLNVSNLAAGSYKLTLVTDTKQSCVSIQVR